MDEAAVAGLGVRFSVLYDPALVDNAEALCGALGEARALIARNRTRVTAPLLTAAPHLAVVGRLGVGPDNRALDACRARGLPHRQTHAQGTHVSVRGVLGDRRLI